MNRSSTLLKNGDLKAPIRNNSRLVDFIEFFLNPHAAILPKLIAFYGQGLSLREIEHRVGLAKTTIRKLLIQSGIELRPTALTLQASNWRQRGKSNIRPVYGFTYFEGEVVKDQTEYPILLFIHRLWKQDKTATEIAHALNGKGYPSRMGKKWSWNAVNGVLTRFKSGTLKL